MRDPAAPPGGACRGVAPPVRLLIVSRHRIFAEAVAASLGSRPAVEVVAAVRTADETGRVLASREVDVVLLDATQDPTAALDLTFRLTEEHPRLRVLPFGVRSEEEAVRLIEAGAGGYLRHEASLEEVVEAVMDLHRGSLPTTLDFAARIAGRIAELEASSGPGVPDVPAGSGLSDREAEVLALVAEGLSNKEIAERLAIRTATVKNHLHSILGKLRVRTRRDAVRRAYMAGLLRGPLRWRPLEGE